MCHAPEGGGNGKVGVTHSEIFQVALNLYLVEKLHAWVLSIILMHLFQQLLGGGGGILN